jgi:hypothetical protein
MGGPPRRDREFDFPPERFRDRHDERYDDRYERERWGAPPGPRDYPPDPRADYGWREPMPPPPRGDPWAYRDPRDRYPDRPPSPPRYRGEVSIF